MRDPLAQERWGGCVEQATQDIELITDAANDLYNEAREAQVATAAVQYHVFNEDTDELEIIQAANALKQDIGQRVGSIRDQINRLRDDVRALSYIAPTYRDSV